MLPRERGNTGEIKCSSAPVLRLFALMAAEGLGGGAGQSVVRESPAIIATEGRQPDRLLLWPEVERIVRFSRMHVGRLEKAGKFPRRVQRSENSVGWWESEILAWAHNRPRGPLPIGPHPEAA